MAAGQRRKRAWCGDAHNWRNGVLRGGSQSEPGAAMATKKLRRMRSSMATVTAVHPAERVAKDERTRVRMNERQHRSILCRTVFGSLILCIAGCDDGHLSRDASPVFSEVIKRHQDSAWHLYFADGVGGLHELDLKGRVSRKFAIGNRFTKFGYSTSLNRFVVIEEVYRGAHISVPGIPHQVPTYDLLMHHVDSGGQIDRTISIPELERGIGDAVFAPSGRYALVAANSRHRVAERRGPSDFDWFRVKDVYLIDTTTGTAQLLIEESCRDLGSIHPAEDSFLFTNADGVICRFTLLNQCTTPLIWGSRPLWNSSGSAIRFVKALQWHRQKGDTAYWSLTGDQSVEYEYDPETNEERRIGSAGRLHIWSPDREWGIRFFHFDSWKRGVNRARAVIETADLQHRSTVITDMPFPWSPIWIETIPDD